MTTVSGSIYGNDNVHTLDQFASLRFGVDHISSSSTKHVVHNPSGDIITFTGSEFAYDEDDTPVGGQVTQIQILSSGSTSPTTLSGFNLHFDNLINDFAADNISDLETLFFGGNDTFTSHATPSSNPAHLHQNHFEGFAGNDTFNMQTSEGDDTLLGDAGNDTFNFGGAFTAKEKIDGGSGTDTANLSGNYASGVTFAATTMVNVEKIVLAAGHDYKLTTNNATVAAGKTLTIDGSALSTSNVLTFSGAAETNGHFIIIGGKGGDKLTGGALSDTFAYTSASQSTGTHYDTITGFKFGTDSFDIPGGAGVITGINTKVTSGALSTATFDANLSSAISSSRLGAHHAVLFTPNGGTLSGQTFLVVDLNGVAGYQSGADLVIRMNGSSGTLAAGGFH